MSYVNRFRHDIFLSYSHTDDSTWINAFELSLLQELREKLGQEPSIWQDVKNIRLGQNWKDEIKEAITGSAVYITILSPGYKASQWCGRERKCFLDQFARIDDMKVGLKVGSTYRFLKIIKRPWENDAHLEFFSEAQHMDFFQRDPAGIDRELIPGTEPFQSRLKEAAYHIAALLQAMRRMEESVFLASTAEDVEAPAEDLRNELQMQGYVLLPEGPVDDLFSDRAIKDEIDPALLSVHLVGAQYSKVAERQIRLALDLSKKLVFWIQKGSFETPDTQQKRLLEFISKADGFTSEFTLLQDTSVRDMIAEVLHLLKPDPEPYPVKKGTTPSIYLICDRSAKEDSEFAENLRETIQTKEGFQVLLPEANSPAGVSIAEMHQARLRDCDGVLLYRSVAPLPWLQQQAPGVLLAEQILQRPLFRAKAFLVNDPGLLPGFPNVIQRLPQFDLRVLEPFLIPFRVAGEAHAGRSI
jgi:hypothetical protein